MHAIAALDECLKTLAQIASYAEQGLIKPAHQHDTLLAIQSACVEIYKTIWEIADTIPEEDRWIPIGTPIN